MQVKDAEAEQVIHRATPCSTTSADELDGPECTPSQALYCVDVSIHTVSCNSIVCYAVAMIINYVLNKYSLYKKKIDSPLWYVVCTYYVPYVFTTR